VELSVRDLATGAGFHIDVRLWSAEIWRLNRQHIMLICRDFYSADSGNTGRQDRQLVVVVDPAEA
jgi:hypothetical protein